MTEKEPIILIVDDDKNNLLSLEKIFQRESMQVIAVLDPKAALEKCRTMPISVVVTDLMMPGMDGNELLRAIKTISADSEVVLMTAYGTVETAVEAMKQGAYDFVEKPLKRANIVKTVKKALEKNALVAENRYLKNRLKVIEKKSIVGNSPVFRHTLEMAKQAAPSVANILVAGESGTGKELVARYVHDNSNRADRQFIAVNCAALPETIMEAELFGYERGAFTGAVEQRDGRFKSADGGTIFLDEIGEMSPAVQVKLLRVLQEGEFEPLGGKTQKVDVRIVAATNRDLEEEVKKGTFREDLYYRLNVVTITLPPLRQRMEDLTMLAEYFLNIHATRNNKTLTGISSEAFEILSGYLWPGNVRELENVVERAVVLSRSESITEDDLPPKLRGAERYQGQLSFSIGTPLAEIELSMIQETLKHTKGDKKLAAQLLGIATRTIYRKLELAD